jgi:hypothetical protein
VLSLVRAGFCALLVLCGLVLTGDRAAALEPIVVPQDRGAVDLTRVIERFTSEGDRVQVTTAPSAEGVVRRIEVRAHKPGQANWALFALTNTSDEQTACSSPRITAWSVPASSGPISVPSAS